MREIGPRRPHGLQQILHRWGWRQICRGVYDSFGHVTFFVRSQGIDLEKGLPTTIPHTVEVPSLFVVGTVHEFTVDQLVETGKPFWDFERFVKILKRN